MQPTKATLSLIAFLAMVFVYLLARVWGNIPSVSPDEYLHAKFARYSNLSDAEIPSYLYYAVYRLTVLFGDEFLDVARTLNALFFISGCFLVYIVACRYISDWQACYVAIIAALSPINTYVNYFMPEAMFYFFFWLFLVTITYKGWRYSYAGNMIIGVVYGALLLVKPHALIALPIYPLASLMVNDDRLPSIKTSLAFIAVALFVKFTVSFMVAGTDGLTIFGSLYSRHATDALSGSIDIAYTLRSFFLNVFSNTFALASVFGLALVYLLIIWPKGASDEGERFIKWLIVWTLIIFVPFVAVFATTAAIFDDNINYRIYMRYYNYTFPLIYIYALAHWDKSFQSIPLAVKLGVASVVVAPIIYIAYHYATSLRMLPYKVLGTDTPEFFLLSYNGVLFYIAISILLVTMFLWVAIPKAALRGFIYIYLPIYLVITNINSWYWIQSRNIPTTADRAGLTAATIIPSAEHGNVLVVGTHDLELVRFLLYLDSGESEYLETNANDSLDVGNIDPRYRWIVTIGEFELTGKASIDERSDNFAIYRIE